MIKLKLRSKWITAFDVAICLLMLGAVSAARAESDLSGKQFSAVSMSDRDSDTGTVNLFQYVEVQ